MLRASLQTSSALRYSSIAGKAGRQWQSAQAGAVPFVAKVRKPLSIRNCFRIGTLTTYELTEDFCRYSEA